LQYLVQMKLADSVRPRSPEESIAFIKQYVFPTLEVCDKLLEEKKIVAGGPLGGAIALALVVRAESIQELDDLIESLPIWPLMQTTVIPLTSFEGRRVAGRQRLEGEVRRAGERSQAAAATRGGEPAARSQSRRRRSTRRI